MWRGAQAVSRPRAALFTEDCSFFLGRHVVRARPLPGCEGCNAACLRACSSSTQAAEFFRMPFRDVVILNTAVEI